MATRYFTTKPTALRDVTQPYTPTTNHTHTHTHNHNNNTHATTNNTNNTNQPTYTYHTQTISIKPATTPPEQPIRAIGLQCLSTAKTHYSMLATHLGAHGGMHALTLFCSARGVVAFFSSLIFAATVDLLKARDCFGESSIVWRHDMVLLALC